MDIFKIILGTIYLILSVILIYLGYQEENNKVFYGVFGFMFLLTSAILISNI